MRSKQRNGRFSNIKLVYRPGSNLIKIALLAVIALSTVALVTIQVGINQNKELLEAKRQEAILLEQENLALEQDIEALGSRDSIIEIAGKQLGLVPNIILYITAD